MSKLLNINNLSSIDDDKCEITSKTLQSIKPSEYIFYDYNNDKCGDLNARNIQTSEVGINFSGERGNIQTMSGKDGCLIDNDDKLRRDNLTNKKYINQLQTNRISLTVPYIHGVYDVNNENSLVSLLTSVDKPCNSLVNSNEKIEHHYYTPMIDKLHSEVQDTNHIIQENIDDNWVRGGVSTREIMRNIDYNKRCK